MKPPSLGECHLWHASESAGLSEARQRRLLGWLTRDELARHRAFRFERHRDQFLLTRALVRAALSSYVGLLPERWRFTLGAHGKPRLATDTPFPLDFNLSNTDGLVVCAVTAGTEVGVDVEDSERPGETSSVASRYFSEREVRDLFALPSEQRRARFFEYWTLKESYIKARGLGLALPLEQFSFVLDAAAIRVVFDPRLGDDENAWWFHSSTPSPRHTLAIAVRRKEAVEVVWHEASPGED
ncbi:MAG: 4'-phosphopantetheinyl transferase superfamily protein [Polyangiaceae bacterium]